MSELKLCKDCIHFNSATGDYFCCRNNTKEIKTSLVTGEDIVVYSKKEPLDCESERYPKINVRGLLNPSLEEKIKHIGDLCFEEGRFFEAKD